MPQYGFQLCGVGFSRIAQIDLMMFSAEFNMIAITVFLREGSHPINRGGLRRLKIDVHGLYAKPFFKCTQEHR
jgi:hypothetical protein